jgi:hypothetical protein
VESVWTFTSPRPSQLDALPSYEYCGPDVTRGCSFLPLIFAKYALGVDRAGRAPAGAPEQFTLTGYHQAHQTGAPPVTNAKVDVSFDDGATWTDDPDVTPVGGGTFQVTVPAAPPAGTTSTGYVSLRVQLFDTASDSLSQTIIRAYGLPGGGG